MKLKDRVMLITGGSGALGQTVVPAFRAEGARVFVAANHAEPPPSDDTVLEADVTNETEVQRVVNDVVEKAGQIDGLINLVGAFAPGSVMETRLSVWQRMLTLNVTTAFVLSKTVASHMLRQGRGRILHVAAWAAVDPFPGAAAYIVAKASLLTLVKVLALELRGTGITVNAVLPTTIDTPGNRTSMPQADRSTWTSPESIAQTLSFLASDDAHQISGAAIPIGRYGGMQLEGKS
ncbi:MAG: SDR family oxidoreductase [Nitrospira sp.]